ncbi:MAG: hypothetical protein P0Y59_15720 [Candidatus Sphingomonas phytovorans]|nr:hypothetical protein [Sphingomonas sp.]WEJ98387.1 MAG: hypothetical protein P0Y59_15720 [Sphingomonas sp.]
MISGLIGAVLAAALCLIAERGQKRARANAEGWKTLRPGWLINATVTGMAAMAAFCGYLRFFVGSSRPDADTQMTYALILVIAFGLAALFGMWTNYGRTIMWKGDQLRLRTIFGHDAVRRISEVRSVTKSEMRGEYRLMFHDGSTLWLSAYLHGANELVAKLPRRAGND